MPRSLLITKADGNKEVFSVDKLKKSMFRSGVSEPVINQTISQIKKKIKPGVSTSRIYRLAFNNLKSANKVYAAKYSLKKAVMDLGPDGFPFEKYFAALLKDQGYLTFTNVVVKGKCITHEVDIIAEKPQKNIHAIIEAKFHSRSGGKTASKDALYTHARFLDIKEFWNRQKILGAKPSTGQLESWLVTNTKITAEARQYCLCSGIKVVGWDYSSIGDNLEQMIHHKGLYPITVLTSLNNESKRKLLGHGVVLCKDLLDDKNSKLLKRLYLKKGQLNRLLDEVKLLLR
ncbi:MAG: ATP cone domain-containing protein [Patescibacteria group bacterium]|jgi:hypothetical protein|nr:ATP cone domain-containing protein [Patescibacteria group bacterium]